MACKKWILRILRVAGFAALAVVLLTFIAVQFQQRLLRWRAERLMADMHQIRLYQSTWADAQKLMYKWGSWGHYDGSCTEADCRYEINLTDASWRSWNRERSGEAGWLWRNRAANLIYRWLGGRYAIVHCAFIVQDDAIWRTITWVNIAVAPKLWNKDDYGYVLIVSAKGQQVLRDTEGGGWVLGGEDLPPEYPYYKMGRPIGCTGCLMAEVTYSTRTPQSEIVRLTSFDFSCLTRLISCKFPEDVMPAVREDNHYADHDSINHESAVSTLKPDNCNGLLWAEARDAGTVLDVDALSISEQNGYNGPYQIAQAKVVAYLKGGTRWPVGSILKVAAEKMIPGKRYLILPSEEPYGKPDRYEDESEICPARCGVQEDTPEVRRELEKGFAQNDNLRGPELR
jgi:hypothetical protein